LFHPSSQLQPTDTTSTRHSQQSQLTSCQLNFNFELEWPDHHNCYLRLNYLKNPTWNILFVAASKQQSPHLAKCRTSVNMNKFVVRLPGGHQPKKASYDGKSLQQKSCNRSSNKCTQVYLDLGQKSMGRTEKCSTCHMLYVKDDIDDVRSHQEFCKQVP